MRGVSESSPTRVMAEDLDVEAMLEAPYKKGVSLVFLLTLYRFHFFYFPFFFSLSLSLIWSLDRRRFRLVHVRASHCKYWMARRVSFSLFFFIFFFLICALAVLWEKGNLPLSSIPLSRSIILCIFSISLCDIWIVLYTNIYIYRQSTPLSLIYQLLINTSVFCTYRWYVTCTLALIGCAPASSLHMKLRGIKKQQSSNIILYFFFLSLSFFLVTPFFYIFLYFFLTKV